MLSVPNPQTILEPQIHMLKTGILLLNKKYTGNNGEVEMVQRRAHDFLLKQASKEPSYLIMSGQSQDLVFSPLEEYNIKLHQVLLTPQMKSKEVQNIIKVTYS